MNTMFSTTSTGANDSAKTRTLETLFQVICSDNEFTLLRKTLELYCEEIAMLGINGTHVEATGSR